MKVTIYYPDDRLAGHTQDYRELHLDRVPLVGEGIVIDDLNLTVRSVTTLVREYGDTTSRVEYNVTAS